MPDRNPMHLTVAIYGLAPASNKIVSKQTGQWNTFEIQVIDQSYTVILNNNIVTEFVRNRSLEGYIGLQNHDSNHKYHLGIIK